MKELESNAAQSLRENRNELQAAREMLEESQSRVRELEGSIVDLKVNHDVTLSVSRVIIRWKQELM